MEDLVEALRFVRSRMDVALLELEAGDPAAAIEAVSAAAARLEAAIAIAREEAPA